MKRFIIIFFAIGICLAVQIVRAPNVVVVNNAENDLSRESQYLNKTNNTISSEHPEPIIIDEIPDHSSTSGTEGKNIIFAEDGHNIAVIYGRSSGYPENIMLVYVVYSTNLGNTWFSYGPLSTFYARRCHSGLDAEQNWPEPSDLTIHFAWHQAARISGAYDSSPCFYAKEVSYPDGLIPSVIWLPKSGTRDVWLPCIAVNDSFVVITAYNPGTYTFNYDCFIWRSTNFGESWDTGRVFFPGPLSWNGGPHFRFGNDGYMFFLWNRELESNPALYWPYFCESFDYGYTWTEPQLVWQNIPPYPDMSDVTSRSHRYDCEVVRDTPVVTVELSSSSYDYGEIWVYRPVSGHPGTWIFHGNKLVSGDSTAPQTFARYPSIAADDNGNSYIGYQKIFDTPTDTGPDIGLFVRPSNQDTWCDYGRCTFNGANIAECHLEFAHNAPIVNDSVIIGMIYHGGGVYPETLRLYFDSYEIHLPGIQELSSNITSKLKIEVKPNPFRTQLFFSYPKSNDVSLQIFDASGRMVYHKISNGQSKSIIWDGRNLNGLSMPTGVYFYRLKTNKNSAVGKVIRDR